MSRQGSGMTIRVTVGDTWVPVVLDTSPEEAVASAKARALASQMIAVAEGPGYEVKFGGAQVADESMSLGALGVPDGGALIVLSRRRRPVR